MAKPGRPTKYKKEYCQLLEEMLAQGKFAVTFCAEVGISEHTFQDWVKKHDDFSQSYKRGRAAAKELFMSKLETAAWEPAHKVNNTLIALLAVNVHGLRTAKDKAEDFENVEEPASVEITIKSARKSGTE